MPTEKRRARAARRRGWIRVVGFCLVLLLPASVLADVVSGKVVKVSDDDTLYVLDVQGTYRRSTSLTIAKQTDRWRTGRTGAGKTRECPRALSTTKQWGAGALIAQDVGSVLRCFFRNKMAAGSSTCFSSISR